jgi:hypothetical protein
MKVGKVPVAAIILIFVALCSFVLNKIYPGEYGFESPFIRGIFIGAILVYALYYIDIWVKASAANRKENTISEKA